MQSLSGEKFKRIRSLKAERHRKKESRFLIEGLRTCEEAISSFWEVELVLYTADFVQSVRGKKLIEKFREKGIEIFRVKNKDLEKLSETKTPQGIMGVIKKKKFYLDKSVLKKATLLLGLDNIRDPGNLGTIIRTADAAGTDGVLLSRGCVELYNPKVVRSSMGSIFHLPIVENLELRKIIPELKKSGFKIYASEVRAGKDYTSLKYADKICLLVGSEASGISKGILKLADERIKIPIYGKAESLNASVAAGILLYQLVYKKETSNQGDRNL